MSVSAANAGLWWRLRTGLGLIFKCLYRPALATATATTAYVWRYRCGYALNRLKVIDYRNKVSHSSENKISLRTQFRFLLKSVHCPSQMILSAYFSGTANNYHPQTKFVKVMFLHLSVSHSVQGGLHPEGSACKEEVCAEGSALGGLHLGICIWGVCIQAGLHPGGSASGGWEYLPPSSDTMGYGQRAGGKHPTGMHSCLSRNMCNG